MDTLFANIGIFLTLVTYAYVGNQFTARRVFVVTAYMQLLCIWLVFFFSNAILCSSEALVSIGRIEEFLLLPERKIELEEAAQIKNKSSNWNLKKDQQKKSEKHGHTKRQIDIAFTKRRFLWTPNEKRQLPEIVFRKATAAWMRGNKECSNTGKFYFTEKYSY